VNARTLGRTQWALAVVLGLLTVVLLSIGHRDVGYVRDEGIYFDASRSYAGWVAQLAREPGEALRAQTRDNAFAINHEHPALMKIAGGLAARLLSRPTADGRQGAIPVMHEGAAMRLPAQILAGLGVTLLFAIGFRRGGLVPGLLAAGFFILLPRVWFNAGLHAFDVPVAVATLAVALVYRRALHDRRFGIALGPLLGLAIAIKHNALFLGMLLGVHYYATLLLARRDGEPITRGQWFPLPLVSMATLAPLTAFALWPWLWSAPIERFAEYLAFHRQHSWYNMEFLGVNYNQPPMPVGYASVMAWATVPTVLLLLAALGLALGVGTDLRRGPLVETRPSFAAPIPGRRRDGLLFAMLGLFPVALISLPSTPIFGGTKHFITAYPFLALAAADAWALLWARVELGARTRVLQPAAFVLCLGPSAFATVDGHPFGLSQYAPLPGGPRGAAELGLNRGFWGHAVLPLLPEIEGDRLYLHDLHEYARQQYAREGRWPRGVEPVPPSRATDALLFHEHHMVSDEVTVWNAMHTTAPCSVLSLDDVPLTSLYCGR
jgi:hypothetical protein